MAHSVENALCELEMTEDVTQDWNTYEFITGKWPITAAKVYHKTGATALSTRRNEAFLWDNRSILVSVQENEVYITVGPVKTAYTRFFKDERINLIICFVFY